jgi:hypothetical protein
VLGSCSDFRENVRISVDQFRIQSLLV